jgi:hypothetical protein
MAAKPTATLRVEWRTDRKLILKEIVAVGEDRRPVTLKVLNIAPDPADADSEGKLLEYARRAASHAELVVTGKKRLAAISRDAARRAHQDIKTAIERLQAFEQSLSYRISE